MAPARESVMIPTTKKRRTHSPESKARVALEALVHELPHLERREPAVEHIDSYVVRGPSRLDLVRGGP